MVATAVCIVFCIVAKQRVSDICTEQKMCFDGVLKVWSYGSNGLKSIINLCYDCGKD
jgi:hypothetical protein